MEATSEAQEEAGLGCKTGKGGVVGEAGGETKAIEGDFGAVATSASLTTLCIAPSRSGGTTLGVDSEISICRRYGEPVPGMKASVC